jgi:hypothetical protein
MNEPAIGPVLMFAVVLSPIYVMLVGWFAERPREVRPALIGVGYLVGFTLAAWAGAALLGVLLGLFFF